jgi:uncharacterized protein (DUF1501 family)
MHLIDPMPLNRRAFLRRAGQLAAVGAATPLGLNLAAIGEAAAFTATDYKALVCVFLYGGNDHANTIVAYDEASWQRYRNIRQAGPGPAGLALERAALAATRLQPATPLGGGLAYALHPAMAGLAGLFNSGQAAALLNVGPLIQPTTREDYFSPDRANHPLPPQLMSHNDQQSVWQSQRAEGSASGWGGQIGDLALANNGQALFTCISASGNAVFLSGQHCSTRSAATGRWPSAGSSTARTASTAMPTRPGWPRACVRCSPRHGATCSSTSTTAWPGAPSGPRSRCAPRWTARRRWPRRSRPATRWPPNCASWRA